MLVFYWNVGHGRLFHSTDITFLNKTKGWQSHTSVSPPFRGMSGCLGTVHESFLSTKLLVGKGGFNCHFWNPPSYILVLISV